MCRARWSISCICCWSCVTHGPGSCMDAANLPANCGPRTAWSLLQPANVFSQPPPPLLSPLSCSSSLSLTLPFFPKLSLLFSMSYCPLHLSPLLPFSLSRANHSPAHSSFPTTCSLTRAHALTHWHTQTVAATTTVNNLPHTPAKAVCKCLWLALTHILI